MSKCVVVLSPFSITTLTPPLDESYDITWNEDHEVNDSVEETVHLYIYTIDGKVHIFIPTDVFWDIVFYVFLCVCFMAGCGWLPWVLCGVGGRKGVNCTRLIRSIGTLGENY